jgi:LysM repeat protein
MQNKRSVFFLLLCFLFKFSAAQNTQDILAYIAQYKEIAMSEMQRTGVPAAITLAQGIHETEAGTSVLVKKSNNHFGIKCKSDWVGESVSHDDDAEGECFRKYTAAIDSYKDHSDFLKNSSRYAFLFQFDPTDYKSWAYGLKRAGYATNPQYPQILINLIRSYNLQDYTLIAMGKTKPAEIIVKNETLQKKNEVIQKRKPEIIVAAEPNVISEGKKPLVIPAVSIEPKYPSGEFKINETRVIYVKRGTSFLSIAQQYELPLNRIFDFNDMKEQDVAESSQLIFIQRKRKTGDHEFHVVQPDETIYNIAQTEAIRLESIMEYNWLKPSMEPALGEKLYLRTKAPAMPRLKIPEKAIATDYYASIRSLTKNIENTQQSSLNFENYFTHNVQPKETVYSIAKKYDIRVEDLLKWNQLQTYDLKTGQALKIYK